MGLCGAPALVLCLALCRPRSSAPPRRCVVCALAAEQRWGQLPGSPFASRLEHRNLKCCCQVCGMPAGYLAVSLRACSLPLAGSWRGACLRVLGARAASAESMWLPAGASALLSEAVPS